MAPTRAPKSVRSTQDNPPKLPRLPSNARVQKRPILHPAISSPYAGASQQKVVYISTKTPFVSAVKRVRKLLAIIDKRAVGMVHLIKSKGSDKQKMRALEEEMEKSRKGKEPEEVVMKASGKAIEKALGFALFFQEQPDCRVQIRTGSVGVVDDIVEVEKPKDARQMRNVEKDAEATGSIPVASADDGNHEKNADADMTDLPEVRIRRTSIVEVGVCLISAAVGL